jgi:glycosyltransferase involved in cell wall biosynthesis
MKVLYTITRYWPAVGGAEIHLHENIQRLPPEVEPRVRAFWNTNRTDWLWGTTVKAPCFEPYSDGRAQVHPLCMRFFYRLRLTFPSAVYYPFKIYSLTPLTKALEPLLMGEQFDLVHNVRVGREPLSLASYKVAKKKNKPFVFTPLHHPRWVGWFYRQYLELYRQADALIATTEIEKQTLIQLGVKEERIFVRGIGAIVDKPGDGAAFRQKHKLEDVPLVLFLGQKYPYKGFEAMLKAADTVWQKFPKTHFVFIGPRTPESLKVFAGVTDKRILEFDRVDAQEKSNALAACDVFCVPSEQESFGGVYLEAWHFKKPVIGGNIPAISEVIGEGEDGLLVDQTPQNIANALIALLEDEKARVKMGQKGYQKTLTKYSWENSTKQLMAAYRSVLGSSNNR